MLTKHISHKFELKSLSETGSFSGYGSVFRVLDKGYDIVAPGAYKQTLEEHNRAGTMPKMLWQHNTEEPIGIWTKMLEDDHGLYVEGQLILDVQRGKEAYALLKAGALDGLSIGYKTDLAEFDNNTGIRTLKQVTLRELSLVTFAMCEPAKVTDVKAAESIKTIRDFETFLRDEGGFSNAAAKAIAVGGFKARTEHRDDDESSLTGMLAEHNARLKHLIKG